MRTPFRRSRPTFTRPRLEDLEERVVPTVQIFIDFGENFPALGLQTTTTQLANTLALNGLQGPDLTLYGIATGKLQMLPSRPLIEGVIDYNGDGVLDTLDFNDYKSDILALLNRYFEPFNVNIQEAASSSVAQIQAKLGANNASPIASGIADTYVIISQVFDGGGLSIGPSNFLNYAPGTDTFYSTIFNSGLATNDLDNTVVGFADQLMAGPSGATTRYARSLFAANMIAQGIGQSFAVPIAESYPYYYTPDTSLLTGAEFMNSLGALYFGTATGFEDTDFGLFTRFPLTDGSYFNFNVDTTINSYGVMATPSITHIGAKSDPTLAGPGLPNPSGIIGPGYVSGTGANDVITVTKLTSTTARVTVQPYRNSAFYGIVDLPGTPASTISYTVDMTGGLLIDTSIGTDRIILDSSLGKNVTIRGGRGTEELVINGKVAAGVAQSAVYTPGGTAKIGLDGLVDRRGTVDVVFDPMTKMTVKFQEFELGGKVTINNVSSVTVQSPGGVDAIDLLTSDNSLLVRGKVNGTTPLDGTDLVQLYVNNAATFLVNTGNLDSVGTQDDVVTVKEALTSVTGLQNVIVLTGAGDDRFVIQQGDLTLPVTGGGYTYYGGDGNDRLEVTADTFNLPAGEALNFLGQGGDDTLAMSASSLNVAPGGQVIFYGDDLGQAGNDHAVIGSGSVSFFFFSGGDGNDTTTLTGNLSIPPGSTFIYSAGDGDDRMEVGGNVSFGRFGTFAYDGGPGSDTIATISGSHTWTVGVNTINLDGKLTFTTIENAEGGAGADTFVFRPGSVFAGKLDGGGGADVLNLAALASFRATLQPSANTNGFTVSFTGSGSGTVYNIDNVQGGAGLSDALYGLNSASQWTLGPSGGTYATGKYLLGFSGMDVLRGGTSTDLLIANSALSVLSGIVKGGGVGSQVIAPGGTQRLLFDGGGNYDTVRVNGTTIRDTFTIGPNFVSVLGRVLSFVNSEALEVHGGGGNDVFSMASFAYSLARIDLFGDQGADSFNVIASTTTEVHVHGDQPGVFSGGDVMRVNRAGAPGGIPGQNAQSGAFSLIGRKPIFFDGIEFVVGGSSESSSGGGGSQLFPTA